MSSLSHSARSTFYRCRRLWRYKYVDNLEPKQLSKGLRMGSAYSDCLEHWDPTKADEYYMPLLIDAGHQKEVEWMKEELVVTKALATSYMRLYPKHEREIPFDFGREKGFIDGKFDDHNIIENKCKARFGKHELTALALDDQCTAYISAWNQITGIPVDEITLHYHVAVKPAIRQRMTETHDAFCLRLREVCNEERHQDHTVTREQWQVDEYREFIEAAAHDMDNAKTFPMNSNACTMYGMCEFAPVCLAKPEDRADVIKDNYKPKEQRG